MAKQDFITVSPDKISTVMMLAPNGRFGGVSVSLANANSISLYGGNSVERTRFATLAGSIQAGGAVATDSQIAYLQTLIVDDPAAAMAIGASADGVRPVSGLTKAAASKFLDQLKGKI